MKVKDFMTSNVVSCTTDQTVEEAAKLMMNNGFSVVPVVENDQLVGILTESDFVGKEYDVPHALASIKQLFGQVFYFKDVEKIYSDAKSKKLSEIMTKNPTTVSSEHGLTDVVNTMISKGFKRLPVVDDNKLVGIITRKDLLKAFVENK